MRVGIDCAFAGTTADFNKAADAGVEWVGEYFGGQGCYHVWTNNDRAALAASRIPYRLPIWVPAQSFGSDPKQEAQAALAAFHLLGFKSVLAFDVEANSAYTLAWGEAFSEEIRNAGIIPVMYHATSKLVPSWVSSWVALWTGNPPSTLLPRTAQQYRGNTSSYNMSVDFNMAADDFPLEGLSTTTVGGIPTVDVIGLPKGKLSAPITCAIETSTRDGGWLFGADGGVFTWGTAKFHGSVPALGVKLNAPIVAALVAADDQGYTLIGSDGGTFLFGSGPKIPSLA